MYYIFFLFCRVATFPLEKKGKTFSADFLLYVIYKFKKKKCNLYFEISSDEPYLSTFSFCIYFVGSSAACVLLFSLLQGLSIRRS